MKPLYTDSLNSWVGHIPDDVLSDMNKIAPMLKTLGYDAESRNPYYGKPDKECLQNIYKGRFLKNGRFFTNLAFWIYFGNKCKNKTTKRYLENLENIVQKDFKKRVLFSKCAFCFL